MGNVTSVMTANPACCTQDSPLQDVARKMLDNDCGQIPVVDADNRPVGVVTDRDIAIRVVAKGTDHASATAKDAMSTPCKTIKHDMALKDAVNLMETEKIRRVPVVDGDGKLVGIVSVADLATNDKKEATAEVVSSVSQAPAQR